MYESGYRWLAKLGIVFVFVLIGLFMMKWSVAYVTSPDLFDGDRLESRTCRWCGGTGSDNGMLTEMGGPDFKGKCPSCRGVGQVDVIVPGLVRPTRLWGVLLDASQADEEASFSCPPLIKLLPLQTAFASEQTRMIQGAIPGARLEFVPSDGGAAVEVRTDTTGRFTVRLAPGQYTFKAARDGLTPIAESFRIEPLVEPIWLEKAHIVNVESEAEKRSSDGIAFVVALGGPAHPEGFLRIFPLP